MSLPKPVDSNFPKEQTPHFEQKTQNRIDEWLNGPYDPASKEIILNMLKDNPQELAEAFSADLSFGTGGLRGLMGIGSNRMNTYTVAKATQGLANYLNKISSTGETHEVLIGFDSRHNSLSFAAEAACVLAANGIRARLLEHLRPTPLISFGCRHYDCSAAIMITASHNPPEYNGYKAYWRDGGQVVEPHESGIMEEIEKISSLEEVKKSTLSHPLIFRQDDSLDEAYLQAIQPLRLHPQQDDAFGGRLNITYTSLHGTGITLVPKALKDWGFDQIHFVEKQIVPDPDFSTAKSPNPEQKEALKLGIEEMLKNSSDLLIATDPDADRMGVAVLHQGKPVILNGNEIAAICIEHLCSTLSSANKLPKKAAFVTTIVSSELLKTICESYHTPCFEVLTGFKYIAEKIHLWESTQNGYHFIFGAEESYGYLLGSVARDKDAIISSCLIAEIALHAKRQNVTLVDLLHAIFNKYGIFREKQLSLHFKGSDEISRLMENLRRHIPNSIAGQHVLSIEDYQSGLKLHLHSGQSEILTLPKSNVILFRLENGNKVIVRPSGTEPKVKIYACVKITAFTSISEGLARAEKSLDSLLEAFNP